MALKRVEPDPDADADAEDDEFFDPSDFDDEDAARSERTGAPEFCLVAAAAISAATWFALFFLIGSTLISAASSSAVIPPSTAAIPPPLALFADADAALHSQDAIYLLEGDNVGR